MNLRTGCVLFVIALSLGLVGCSTTKTVSVVTERENWVTGQHDYCVYKGDKIICMPQGTPVGNAELRAQLKPGEQVKVEDALFMNSIGFMTDVEEALRKGDKTLHVSVFDTKFSERPNDYSIWNCISTGKGSPAVECSVMKQPSAKDKELLSRRLQEQQVAKEAVATMAALNRKTLEERCGSPFQRAEDNTSIAELYKADSKFLAFYFYTTREDHELNLASSMDSPPAKLDHDAVLKGDHNWFGEHSKEASVWFLKQMPCLRTKM